MSTSPGTRSPRNSRLRLLVGVAAVTSGLIVGVVIVSVTGTNKREVTYQPFYAGPLDQVTEQITSGGPVFLPDLSGGTRSVFLDLEDEEIVALWIVPPGGNSTCPVEWEPTLEEYRDCDGRSFDSEDLRRFVISPTSGEDVYVDLREITPAPSEGGS